MFSKKLLIPIFLFFLFSINSFSADKCKDYQIYADGDDVATYGIDTTGHWWIVTKPFTNQYRIIIDGKDCGVYFSLKELIFSPDGNRWAFFGKTNTGWRLVANDTLIDLNATDVTEINYSPNSSVLMFGYKESDLEVMHIGNRKVNVYYRFGRLFLSQGAERFAFLGYRSDKMVVNVNGRESAVYDSIIPIGFWNDGIFLFAAKNGNFWEIYKGDKVISEVLSNVTEVAMNNTGTVAAVLARKQNGYAVAILFSDEYYEPLIGKQYDNISNLTLHPKSELIAYKAVLNNQQMMVLNNTEYMAGETSGKPMFTHDGSEMYFIGCNIDCFANIGGRKYTLQQYDMNLDITCAMKPGSETVAYSTNASMIVRFLNNNNMHAGTMMDELIQPIFNWRTNRYETIGKINKRLFLLTCTN